MPKVFSPHHCKRHSIKALSYIFYIQFKTITHTETETYFKFICETPQNAYTIRPFDSIEQTENNLMRNNMNLAHTLHMSAFQNFILYFLLIDYSMFLLYI